MSPWDIRWPRPRTRSQMIAWIVAGVAIASAVWIGLVPLAFGGSPESRKTLIIATFGVGAIVSAVIVVERLKVQLQGRSSSSQFLPHWIGPGYEAPRQRLHPRAEGEDRPIGPRLPEVDLHEASLPGVDLDNADMAGASLRNADLTAASLLRSNLADADLRGANLRGANLREANIAGGSLEGARLERANLSRANLRGADLRGADLRGASLAAAIYNGETLWPTVFSPEAAGAIQVD